MMKTTVAEILGMYNDNMLLPSAQGINHHYMELLKVYDGSYEVIFGKGHDSILQSSAAEVLTHLPPDIVYRRFGFNAVAWSWLNIAKCNITYDDYLGLVSEAACKPKDIVVTSRAMTNHYADYRQDVGTFLKNCVLLECMRDGLAGLADIGSLLRMFARPGVELSGRRIRGYSLEGIRPGTSRMCGPGHEDYGFEERWGGFRDKGRMYEVYMDGPVGFALMYKERPNAITSFMAVNPETLKITQLQGVNPALIDKSGLRKRDIASARGLMPLEWERLLIVAAIDAAAMLNFKQVCLRSGHNNPWVTSGALSKGRMPLERALERYDNVAERMGFQQGAGRDWYLDITGWNWK